MGEFRAGPLVMPAMDFKSGCFALLFLIYEVYNIWDILIYDL